jgi:hypothetical protein
LAKNTNYESPPYAVFSSLDHKPTNFSLCLSFKFFALTDIHIIAILQPCFGEIYANINCSYSLKNLLYIHMALQHDEYILEDTTIYEHNFLVKSDTNIPSGTSLQI